MKKLFWFPVFIALLNSAQSQNSIMFGMDGMMAEGNFKYWNFVPNANYSFGMGEKWSFQAGAGYLFHSHKEENFLSPRSLSTPESSQLVKYKNSGVQLYGDFKKYFGVHTNEEGGFYIRFGVGYIPIKYKITAATFDTSLYLTNNFESGYTATNRYSIINARVFIGYEKEIVDLLNFYVEGGFNLFIGEGMFSAINIGVRKRFLKL